MVAGGTYRCCESWQSDNDKRNTTYTLSRPDTRLPVTFHFYTVSSRIGNER